MVRRTHGTLLKRDQVEAWKIPPRTPKVGATLGDNV